MDLRAIVENPHVVNQIVERDLCVRCGACAPACPVDIIDFDPVTSYPYITDEPACLHGCTRCLKVCPGEEVEFTTFDDEMFDRRPDPRSVSGVVERALVGHATDPETRYRGASGGFVTQLLVYLLEAGEIDGALVLGDSEGEGPWRPKPVLARTREEIEAAAKSKYLALPFLAPLDEMEEVEGRYAVVALPCHVHALRRYQNVSPMLRERIRLVIGLYCNVVFEPTLAEEACEMAGLDPGRLRDFQFRYGDWPGGVHAILDDGSEHKVLALEEMKDEFNFLKLFYTAPRCNLCTDFSAEYADLAVGDPWLRDEKGDYPYHDGWTTVLVRTEAGDEAVRRAETDGWIGTEAIDLDFYMMNFEFSGRYKRDYVPKKLKLRELIGLAVPEYERELPPGPASGWPSAVARTVIGWLGRSKLFRRLALTLIQTRPGLAFLRWNRKRKASRYADGLEERRRFVQELKEGMRPSPS